MRILNESEVSTLQNALRVAAERFAEHAATFDKTAKGQEGFKRVADQFRKQQRDSLALAESLSEHDGVAFHNDNDMLRETYRRYSRS